jgi:hypothetical protein
VPAGDGSAWARTARDGEGWKVPPIPAEVFNVSAGDREWVNRQCTMQSIATFQQAIKLSGKGDPVKQITFILATGFANSPFTVFYDRAKAMGWNTLTMSCGHDVMLDRPEELTGALLGIAEAQPVQGCSEPRFAGWRRSPLSPASRTRVSSAATSCPTEA